MIAALLAVTLSQISITSPHWDVKCEKDEMTDKRSCTLRNLNGFPIILRRDADGDFLTVGDFRHPHHPTALARVDSNEAVTHDATNEKAVMKTSAEIVQQMVKGKELRFEFWAWPGDMKRGGLDLSDFALAYTELGAQWEGKPSIVRPGYFKERTEATIREEFRKREIARGTDLKRECADWERIFKPRGLDTPLYCLAPMVVAPPTPTAPSPAAPAAKAK